MKIPTRSSRVSVLAVALAGAGVIVPIPAPVVTTRTARAEDERLIPIPVRDSVDKALVWLAKNQKPDGTFPQGAAGGTTAVPSLCVMAFLARGYTPRGEHYGAVLNRSIDYVLDCQQGNGLLSKDIGGNPVMYEHAIATVMLAQCRNLADDARRARIEKAVDRSIAFILCAQHPTGEPKKTPYTGGWRYTPRSADADTSVTGWYMLAIYTTAAECGTVVPREDLEAARDYIRRSASPGGGFAYQPGQDPTIECTGIGILMMELYSGLDERPKEAVAGGDYLMMHPPGDPKSEFYFCEIYFCSKALRELGGKYWKDLYERKIRDPLIAQQAADGSFDGGGKIEAQAGPAYRTAMACLTLAAPVTRIRPVAK